MMMKTPIAAATATAAAAVTAGKVWVRSTSFGPCVFGRSVYETLNTNSLADSAKSPAMLSIPPPWSYHCDRTLVDFEEKEDGSVVMASTPWANETIPAAVTALTNGNGIPLGRARDCPTLMPRALEDDEFDRRRRPFVSLAVVGMVVTGDEDGDGDSDSDGDSSFAKVLITRRPSYMRSFPGAFVFPGGNVDSDDPSLKHALSREIMEETGLVVEEDSWKLECLWESIYPTKLPPPLVEAEEGTDVDVDGAIKAHHLVCYFSGRPQQQQQQQQQQPQSNPQQQAASSPKLNLCEEEVDGAVWMSRENIRDLLEATSRIETGDDPGLPELARDQTIALHASSSSTTDTIMSTGATTNTARDHRIPLSDLAGIYPRLDETNGRFCGMAQGSLFALEEFMRKE